MTDNIYSYLLSFVMVNTHADISNRRLKVPY